LNYGGSLVATNHVELTDTAISYIMGKAKPNLKSLMGQHQVWTEQSAYGG